MSDNTVEFLKNAMKNNEPDQVVLLINRGLDPNFMNGLLLQQATRYGLRDLAYFLIKKGANPYSPGESGVTPLQQAVYSKSDWNKDDWSFLTDCYSSSQLADAAAFAIVNDNYAALNQVFNTGRCNMTIPTSLTGKSVEEMAQMYNKSYLLPSRPPRNSRLSATFVGEALDISSAKSLSPFMPARHRDLSPTVATFFQHASSVPSPVYNATPDEVHHRHSSFLGSPNFSLSPLSPGPRVQ